MARGRRDRVVRRLVPVEVSRDDGCDTPPEVGDILWHVDEHHCLGRVVKIVERVFGPCDSLDRTGKCPGQPADNCQQCWERVECLVDPDGAEDAE